MVVAAQLVGRINMDGAQKAESQLTSVGSKADSAQRHLDKLSSISKQASSSLAGSLSGAVHSAGGALSSMGSRASSAGGGLLDFAAKATIAAQGVAGLIKGAVSLGASLIKPAMESEQLGIAFTTLMGSSEAAAAKLKELAHFADITPFEPGPVKQYAAQLIGMKVSADKTIPIMTALGDALFAVGHGTEAEMGSVVDAIGKISIAGRMTWEDIVQLGEHGIDALGAMAAATGQTEDALHSMASNGGIPATEAIDALTKGIEMNPLYKGGMAKQATSLGGIMSTLSGQVKSSIDSFLGLENGLVRTGSIFDMVRQGAAVLSGWLANPAFNNFATGAGKAVADTFAKIGDWVQKVAASPNFQMLLDTFGDLGKALGDAGREVFNLWRTLSPIGQLFDSAGGSGLTFAGVLTGIRDIIDQYVIPAVSSFSQFISDITPIVQPVAEQVMTIFGQIAGFMSQILPPAMEIGKQVFAGIKDIIEKLTPVVRDQLMPAIQRLIEVVGPIIVDFMKWTAESGVLKLIFDVLGNVLKELFTGVGALIRIVAEVINFFRWWGDATANSGKRILELWTGIQSWFGGLGPWFRDKFNQAVNGIKGAWAGITGWFQARWNDIKNSFPNLYQAGKNIIQSVIDGINAMIGAVKRAAGSVAQAIRDFFPHSPAKLGPLVDIDESMPALGDMLTKGLNAQIGKISKASFNVAAAIHPMPGLAQGSFTPGIRAIPPSLTSMVAASPVVVQVQNFIDGQKLTDNTANRMIRTARNSGPIRSS